MANNIITHFELVGPSDSITFSPEPNADSLFAWMEDVDGIDFGELVVSSKKRSNGPGRVAAVTQDDGRQVDCHGFLWPAEDDSSPIAIYALADRISALLHTIKNTDGLLKWQPPNSLSDMRQVSVRTITGFKPKPGELLTIPFDFSLENLSGLAVDATEQNSGVIAAGGSHVCNNAGDRSTWPILQVHGASSGGCVITNSTHGKTISLPRLALDAGYFAQIDCAARTIHLRAEASPDVDIKRIDGALSPLLAQFFALGTGDNTIGFTGSGTLEVYWHNGRP